MAKFNDYYVVVDRDDGAQILGEGHTVRALSLEAAFHKAVTEAFEACADLKQGVLPSAITVWRRAGAAEHHG